jgi:hypothetical protein
MVDYPVREGRVGRRELPGEHLSTPALMRAMAAQTLGLSGRTSSAAAVEPGAYRTLPAARGALPRGSRRQPADNRSADGWSRTSDAALMKRLL